MNKIPIKKNKIRKNQIIMNKNLKVNPKNYYHKRNSKTMKIRNNSKFNLLNFDGNIISNKCSIKNEKMSKNNISTKKLLIKKEFEFNSLNYQEVLNRDYRNYCQYYLYLLKYNHPISFSFASYNDYNRQIIKKFLFFFSFSLDFTINAAFFTDETIHKIYQDKGQINFLYHIPQTLYSTLIAKFIDTVVKILALPQDNIIELKQDKIKNFETRQKNLFRKLSINFTLFLILALLILIFS